MTNSPSIMEYMIRIKKKDEKQDDAEKRTQGEEVTEETTDKIVVAPKQNNPLEKEFEKEKEKPENYETEKTLKRGQSGEAGGIRATPSQEVRTVWSTPSEEVPKSTST